MKRISCALGLAGVALVGCRDKVSKAPPPEPPVGGEPLAVAALHFENAESRQRVVDVVSCADELDQPGRHWRPWQNEGNFVVGSWCSGTGSRADCYGDDQARDRHSIRVEFLHFGGEATYFGLDLSADWMPPEPGWGARFVFSEGGKDILGETFGVSFIREFKHERDPSNVLTLGDGYGYSIFEQEVTLARRKEAPRVTATRYLASADGLRKEGLDLIARARADFFDRFARHEPRVIEYGPRPRNGGAPDEIPRAPTGAEEEAEKAKATPYFDTQEALLRDHYQEFWAALLHAFPVDRCWK